MQSQLIDPQGRQFPYLRLSVTDVCNFSCQYCLPDGYQCQSKKHELQLNEIENLVIAFSELGVSKIRLTGGEPSVRKDFLEIIRLIKAIPNIKKIAVTTNGYKLEQHIESWHQSGVDYLNVSVDSLDPKLFHSLTGHNRLPAILAGIDKALELGLKQVKLNAVLLKNINSHQLDTYAKLIKYKALSLRFIELMQTGENLAFFNQYHLSASELEQDLKARGWKKKPKAKDAGPAIEYGHSEFKGTFGVIAPYSSDFCDSCNRLRVASDGSFHLCLFGEKGYNVRHLLQSSSQKNKLKQSLHRLLLNKRKQHFLHNGDSGVTPHLASIGG
ncbi:GTP 3',8-cyclase MoaA [Aliikangiella sp. IMCC44653]